MDTSRQALVAYLLVFASVYLFVRYGWATVLYWLRRREEYLDKVLNFQLLLNVNPRLAMVLMGSSITLLGVMGFVLGGLVWFIPFVIIGFCIPTFVLKYLDLRRRTQLEMQLVDGINTVASGVRAGLTLVQAMELLVQNHIGPIRQEFGQMLREYQMGLDLNQAMRNAANRIGLSNYRLLFTAIEMHRIRGGNTGESLDRIAESIREIQRLEGKLDAITAQGRYQAWFIAGSPFFLLAIFYFLDPQAVTALFVEPIGRLILLVCALMVFGGYSWIRRIMTVDI